MLLAPGVTRLHHGHSGSQASHRPWCPWIANAQGEVAMFTPGSLSTGLRSQANVGLNWNSTGWSSACYMGFLISETGLLGGLWDIRYGKH